MGRLQGRPAGHNAVTPPRHGQYFPVAFFIKRRQLPQDSSLLLLVCSSHFAQSSPIELLSIQNREYSRVSGVARGDGGIEGLI